MAATIMAAPIHPGPPRNNYRRDGMPPLPRCRIDRCPLYRDWLQCAPKTFRNQDPRRAHDRPERSGPEPVTSVFNSTAAWRPPDTVPGPGYARQHRGRPTRSPADSWEPTMCLLVLLAWLSPRLAIFVLWVFTDRMTVAFHSFWVGSPGLPAAAVDHSGVGGLLRRPQGRAGLRLVPGDPGLRDRPGVLRLGCAHPPGPRRLTPTPPVTAAGPAGGGSGRRPGRGTGAGPRSAIGRRPARSGRGTHRR